MKQIRSDKEIALGVVDAYERNDGQRRAYRNGYYERDFVTVLGTLQLRIARAGKAFYRWDWSSFKDELQKYRCSFARRFCAALARVRWAG